jgi:hypothetical protein
MTQFYYRFKECPSHWFRFYSKSATYKTSKAYFERMIQNKKGNIKESKDHKVFEYCIYCNGEELPGELLVIGRTAIRPASKMFSGKK